MFTPERVHTPTLLGEEAEAVLTRLPPTLPPTLPPRPPILLPML
jgi:hypothetical protein